MSLHLSRSLLVLLLVLGQVGGWLHGLEHHARPVGGALAADGSAQTSAAPVKSSNSPGSPDSPDSPDDACLVCLTYAALALAILVAAPVFGLAALAFALPAAARFLAHLHRGFARSARGPPVFS